MNYIPKVPQLTLWTLFVLVYEFSIVPRALFDGMAELQVFQKEKQIQTCEHQNC